MIDPDERPDTVAPPCYLEAWRDLDLKRRPHLCGRADAPAYMSALRPKTPGIASTTKPAIDLTLAELAQGRARSLAKRKRGRRDA